MSWSVTPYNVLYIEMNKTVFIVVFILSFVCDVHAQMDEIWGKTEWIALEPADTVMSVGLHFPEARSVFGDRKVGRYKMPVFRTDIKVRKKVRRAMARVCGLGQFEFMLNGEKVGDHFLDPGWTDYSKEALYVDFDIKTLLRKGKNHVEVMLGNGFMNIPNERYYKLITSYGQPRLRMLIYVEYEDGSVESHSTDDQQWQVSESPITFSSIYGGEDYDATRCDSLSWRRPIYVTSDIKLMAQSGVELTMRREIKPVKCFLSGKGRWVYDLGQNFAGIVRVTVKGRRGQTVTLTPAELLRSKDINQSVASPYFWRYTLSGGDCPETWHPQFTYYGFRYVEVDGAVPVGKPNPDGLPVIDNLEGILTCSAAAEVGHFECSDTLMNRIHELIDWAILSNMQSVITDCPQREKLGWVEQDYLMQHSIQYRYDVSSLYRKILNDMSTAARTDGCIPTIAPCYVQFQWGFEDTPEWGSAFIISAWQAYRWYGDDRFFRPHYQSMRRYIDYLKSRRTEDGIIAYGLGDWYDLGPAHPGVSQLTSNGVTATAVFYHDLVLMSHMAEILGEADDAHEYQRLADDVKQCFNKKFFNKDKGCYDRNSQTANAISLYLGLVPDMDKERVLQSLIDDIVGRDYALTAGDIGYRFVLQVLQDAGRGDIIYKMNSRTDVPGYGWQLEHGATSLTESWEALEDVSNNHLMLGHLMEWFYGGLGGITQSSESVGWKHIVIAPQMVDGIRWTNTSFNSPRGRVECNWTNTDDKHYTIDVNIPDGCTADVVFPDGKKTTVSSGRHQWSR